jgi:hypothetical protein
LEVFTSAGLNLEGGFFIVLMMWSAKKQKLINPPKWYIEVPNWIFYVTGTYVLIYFSFAVIYDVFYNFLAIFFDLPF